MTGEGLRWTCIRETQKSLKESAKRLIEDKLTKFGITEQDGFKVFREVIETPKGGLITFDGMQDHTADSFKSKEGFHGMWAEEAHALTERSLNIVTPTIRWESGDIMSELWFTWNPERPTDAIERLLRSTITPPGAIVIRANWNNNPWFPKVLDDERRFDLEHRPERYSHKWEGEYATVLEGAYFASYLNKAQLEGRITAVSRDMLLPVFAFWDLGSTSGKADATTIWIAQFVGDDIRVLDYYEVKGQPFDAHINWLRSRGYEKAICVLPHDGAKHDMVYQITPQGYLGKAGFSVELVTNQGAGAAMMRIEAARQVFHRVRFNEETTKGGRDALGWYHEKQDERRQMGLGPSHDWSSHGADGFGLMAVYAQSRKTQSDWDKPIRSNLKGVN